MKYRYLIFLGVILTALFLTAAWLEAASAQNDLVSLPGTGKPGELSTLASEDLNIEVGMCNDWIPTNDSAFGLGLGEDGSYISEEGFEVTEFNSQLYVGMEADNSLGARLWRTKPGVMIPYSQADWEEVIGDGLGRPFGVSQIEQVDHIDSLAAYQGYIYASTANRSGYDLGSLMFRSQNGDPNTWEPVIEPGFGITANTNIKDLTAFTITLDNDLPAKSWLCGGTGNDQDGAQLWCSPNGMNWTQVNESGFGNPANSLIASQTVFGDRLYVGLASEEGGSVWRTADLVTWEQVYFTATRQRVEIVGALPGQLYIAAGAMDGRLNDDLTLQVFESESGDIGSWQPTGAELALDPGNTRTIVDGGTTYNSALYLATMNTHTGAEVWQTTDGMVWKQVNPDGFGSPTTFAAELIDFHGYLYAWTSDYTRGQRVLRTICPQVQMAAIDGPAAFKFDEVGAVLTLTQESIDSLQVSVYPGAFPLLSGKILPVKRYYSLEPIPSEATMRGALSLAYTPEEFEAANIDPEDEAELFLVHWDGLTWQPCPEDDQGIDLVNRRVICENVASFSDWAIFGPGVLPLTPRLFLPSILR